MKENRKVPEIRFPEFTDDWEQRKLEDVTSEFKSGSFIAAAEIEETGEYPVYGGNGLRGYSETYNHDGEFALIGRQGALCGNMNYSTGKAYFTEHAVAVKANDLANTKFLYYLLDKMNLGQYSDQSAQPGLAVGKIIKLKNMFPSKEEQDRIGDYFTNFDHLITLHQRKCDKIKELKSCMLQKMFPKKGEKAPDIRFPEFTDDWEQRKLCDTLLVLKDGTHGTHVDAEDGPLLLSAKNIKDGSIKWDDTDRRISQEEYEKIHSKFSLMRGDVLLTIVGSIGETAILQDSIGITFQRSVAFLRPNNEIVSEFLYTEIQTPAFQKELDSRKSTSAQPGIYLGDLAEIPVKYSPLIEEQTKIGEYFSNLDHLITLHQRKCDALKELKKGMLQKMFV